MPESIVQESILHIEKDNQSFLTVFKRLPAASGQLWKKAAESTGAKTKEAYARDNSTGSIPEESCSKYHKVNVTLQL